MREEEWGGWVRLGSKQPTRNSVEANTSIVAYLNLKYFSQIPIDKLIPTNKNSLDIELTISCTCNEIKIKMPTYLCLAKTRKNGYVGYLDRFPPTELFFHRKFWNNQN